MDRRGRRVALTVAAAFAGAAIAFPAGLYFARPTTPGDGLRPRAGPVGGSTSVRNRYAPAMLSDPYFIDQQRRVVEALEASCRRSGAHCAEAQATRRRLIDLENGR